ncbi:MAG: metallophosphoesterase family protein [Pseudorhodobacter sp.]
MGEAFRLAVIADAHFHDPEGDFGTGIVLNGQRLALRSGAETATAARAFNESAAALVAALDRIVAARISLVVLAGDYTDDGQAENTRRLARLLHDYRARHGLRFFAIPGNHDCYALTGKHIAATHLHAPGVGRLVTSDPALAKATAGAEFTGAMRCAGVADALEPMAGFGLRRSPDHLHWESPFGSSDRPEDRQYSARSADGTIAHRLMDGSYLVEPEPGLWLLMLDANVFEPRPGIADPRRKRAFFDPADAGWNAVLRIKPFLLDWIGDVCARAERLGKVLVTVSHYPVLPPFGDETGSEAALFPDSTLARRSPGLDVAKALVAAGLRVHLGGHLHVVSRAQAMGLTDFSLPSTVAHPAAFSVLTATPQRQSVETVSLADLPTDPRLDRLYQAEGARPAPTDFGGFLTRQRRCRLLHHRLPRDLPPAVMAALRDQPLPGLLALLTTEPAACFAQRHGLRLPDIPALEVISDALMLREAGALANLPPARMALCRALARAFGTITADPSHSPAEWLARFFAIRGQDT